MAKKRKLKTRTRTIYKKARRTAKKSFGFESIIQPDAMIYGAGRSYLSNLINPLTEKLPLGQFSDEGAMLLVNYIGVKFAPKGILKNVFKKGMIIENSLIGAGLIGMFNNNTNTSSISNSF